MGGRHVAGVAAQGADEAQPGVKKQTSPSTSLTPFKGCDSYDEYIYLRNMKKYVETRHYFKLPLQSSAAFPLFLLLSFDSLFVS
jgi:hypothetical protein